MFYKELENKNFEEEKINKFISINKEGIFKRYYELELTNKKFGEIEETKNEKNINIINVLNNNFYNIKSNDNIFILDFEIHSIEKNMNYLKIFSKKGFDNMENREIDIIIENLQIFSETTKASVIENLKIIFNCNEEDIYNNFKEYVFLIGYKIKEKDYEIILMPNKEWKQI